MSSWTNCPSSRTGGLSLGKTYYTAHHPSHSVLVADNVCKPRLGTGSCPQRQTSLVETGNALPVLVPLLVLVNRSVNSKNSSPFVPSFFSSTSSQNIWWCSCCPRRPKKRVINQNRVRSNAAGVFNPSALLVQSQSSSSADNGIALLGRLPFPAAFEIVIFALWTSRSREYVGDTVGRWSEYPTSLRWRSKEYTIPLIVDGS